MKRQLGLASVIFGVGIASWLGINSLQKTINQEVSEGSTLQSSNEENLETTNALPPSVSPAETGLASLGPKVEAFMEAVSQFAKEPNPYSEDTWKVIDPRFESEIMNDELAFGQLLDFFKRAPKSTEGEIIAILIGNKMGSDPRVQKTALELARSKDKNAKLGGLGLLDRSGFQSPEQQETVLKILEEETDTQILGEAFFALNAEGGLDDHGLQQRFKKVAIQHSSSKDQETRRNALNLLGMVADDRDSFEILVGELDSKSEVIRNTAIRAMKGHAQFLTAETIDKLLSIGEAAPSKILNDDILLTLDGANLDSSQDERAKKLEKTTRKK